MNGQWKCWSTKTVVNKSSFYLISFQILKFKLHVLVLKHTLFTANKLQSFIEFWVIFTNFIFMSVWIFAVEQRLWLHKTLGFTIAPEASRKLRHILRVTNVFDIERQKKTEQPQKQFRECIFTSHIAPWRSRTTFFSKLHQQSESPISGRVAVEWRRTIIGAVACMFAISRNQKYFDGNKNN